jgi:hypothetical protein
MHYNAFEPEENAVEDQLTVRLPRALSKALRERAVRMQRKPSEVVRLAVAEFLRIEEQTADRPAERVKDLIGSLRSGIPDLAVHHREYLVRKLRRAR